MPPCLPLDFFPTFVESHKVFDPIVSKQTKAQHYFFPILACGLQTLGDNPMLSMCNLKREGLKTHSTLTAFNEPRRPCSPDLLHTVQTFYHTQHTSCLLTLSDEHYKIKDVQVLCFHTTTEQILQYPSHASPTHTDANKGNSLITLQTIYIPRKHKLAFHQMFTITPNSQCRLVSLSRVPLQ